MKFVPSPNVDDDQLADENGEGDQYLYTQTAWVEAPAYFGESVLWVPTSADLPPAVYYAKFFLPNVRVSRYFLVLARSCYSEDEVLTFFYESP